MIRVLTYDNNFSLMERAKIESIEYQFPGRVNRGSVIFIADKVGELDKIILLEFRA
jgi:hypothetical protein